MINEVLAEDNFFFKTLTPLQNNIPNTYIIVLSLLLIVRHN